MGNVKLSTKFLSAGLVVGCAIWLWYSSDTRSPEMSANAAQDSVPVSSPTGHSVSGNLVSKIAPADQTIETTAEPQKRAWSDPDSRPFTALDEQSSKALTRRFNMANSKVEQRDWQGAEQHYKALIEEFPNFVEPYINLAAVYAQNGQLEAARQTLMDATNANPSTELLFQSINQLHGALAAAAYRNALETEVESSMTAELPLVTRFSTDFEHEQQINTLNQQLVAAKSQEASLSASNAELSALKIQLTDASEQLAEMQTKHKAAIEGLQQQLALSHEKERVAAAQLAELRNQSANLDSDLVAKLRIELKNTEAALQAAKDYEGDLLATTKELRNQLSQAEANLMAANALAIKSDTQAGHNTTSTTNTNPTITAISEAQRDTAIELVTSWAQAWSAQDVDSYVGFYQDNYSSSNNLSHQAWVAQRRVRLTNKSFIQVNVRDFDVEASQQGFSVTFTQHYRSNTLDDTIRKRLSFVFTQANENSPGGNWNTAKINDERIVRR